MASGRVRRRAHHPVGESPTEVKRLKPRSLGDSVARKQDVEALRQDSRKEDLANHQVVTHVNAEVASLHSKSGGRDGLQRAKATRTDRKESETTVLSGGVSAAT